ncbi:UNVERIFIED_CONTAM: hypothetical protein FKN15_068784 [Acipenser sinensis]
MAEVDSDTQSEGRPPIYEFEDQQLLDLAEELSHSNAAIKAETEVFERYFSRIDPKDLLPQTLAEQPLLGLSAQEFSQFRGRRKSKSRSMTAERLVRLTVEQKCDVAQRELEEMRDALERLKEGSERVLGNYKSFLDATNRGQLWLGCVDLCGFVESTLVPQIPGVTLLSLPLQQDTLIEKLRLKKAALKVQKRKLQMQLKQKEEMGEALHEVDFQQLKIENSQYLEKIDERNQDLLGLKLLAGNTLQVLSAYKKKLQNMTSESNNLTSELLSRKEMLMKIAAETIQVEEERSKAETVNKRLRGQLSDYQVPNVLDYVTGKASHSDLEQSVHIWERKVEISEMALKTHIQTWNKLKMANGKALDWPHV